MITRVYFLKAKQRNLGSDCHAFRTVIYKSWFPIGCSIIVNDFFKEISKDNELPESDWVLESFSRVK